MLSRAVDVRPALQHRDMARTPLHDPQADPHSRSARETRNTTCYMCACRCGIRVHLPKLAKRLIDGICAVRSSIFRLAFSILISSFKAFKASS